MAKFNEILVGRFNRFLQRFLSMKGGPPSAQLSTEIASQFTLDDAGNLENRFLAGWRSYGFNATVAAGGAGTFAQVRLRNPAASGVIVVVEKIIFSNNAGGVTAPLINRGPAGTVDLAATFTGAIRDLRMGPAASSSILSTGVPVTIPGATLWTGVSLVNTSIDAILDEHQEIVVAPNDVLTMSLQANSALTVSLFWRERTLEEGES